MNNKSQKIINYLSAIIFLSIFLVIILIINNQNKKTKEIVPTTTSTTLVSSSFSPGSKYLISKNFLISLLAQSGIKISGDGKYELVQNPQVQEILIEKLEPIFIEILNQQPKVNEVSIRELAIALRLSKTGDIFMFINNLSDPKDFRKGDLGIFLINVNDALRQKNIRFTQDDIMYFCGVIKPELILPGAISYYQNFGQTFIFPEGKVSCSNGLKMNIEHLGWSIGIIDQNYYQLKIYLVDENTKEKIKEISSIKNSSIKKAEEILDNYNLIYNKEVKLKSINSF